MNELDERASKLEAGHSPNDSVEPDDRVLVKRCQAGDSNAFNELVIRYRKQGFYDGVRHGPERARRLGSRSGRVPESLEIDSPVQGAVFFLYLALSDHDQCDDRFASPER